MSDIDSPRPHVKKKTARRNGFLTLSEAQRQFADHIASQLGGYAPNPGKMIADGEWHRFPSAGDKRGQESGTYKLYPDAPFVGLFKDHRSGIEGKWSPAVDASNLTPAERAAACEANRRRAEKTNRKRQAKHERRAIKAQETWAAAKPAPADHPYLVRKGVQPHGLRIGADGRLIVPVYSKDGKLQAVEFISADGTKLFLWGTTVAGGHFILGEITEATERVLVAEGYATGASIHQATGSPVIVAFNAGNLLNVASWLRQQYPGVLFVICADDDRWTKGNPGITKGRAAADILGAAIAIPDFTGIDGKPTDFNDLAEKRGGGEVARQIKAALAQHAERAKRQESAAAAELPELPPFELPAMFSNEGRARLKALVVAFFDALERHAERLKWREARLKKLLDEAEANDHPLDSEDWSDEGEKKRHQRLSANATRAATKKFGKIEDAIAFLSIQIAATPGIGKTRILAAEYRRRPRLWGLNISYFAPNIRACRAFAAEINEDTKENPLPPGMPRAETLSGYTYSDEDMQEPDCPKHDLVGKAYGKVQSIAKSFCDNGVVRCEFFGSCLYTKKRLDETPKVRCFPHKTATTPQSQEMKTPEPDLVIIDESFIATAVKHTRVDPAKLIDPETFTSDPEDKMPMETPAEHAALGRQVLELLKTVPDVPRKLLESDAERIKAREKNIGPDRAQLEPDQKHIARRLYRGADAAARTGGELAPVIPSDDAETVLEKLANITGDRHAKAVAALLGQLAWDVAEGGYPDSLSVEFVPGKQGKDGKLIPECIYVHGMRDIYPVGKDTPLILIDADAIREVNEIIFDRRRMRWEEIRCKHGCPVTQANNFLGSTSELAPYLDKENPGSVEHCRRAQERLDEIGHFIGHRSKSKTKKVLATSALPVRLKLTGETPDKNSKLPVSYPDPRGFDASHNGVIIGRNLWHQHNVVVQIGREEPACRTDDGGGIERIARAVYARARGVGFEPMKLPGAYVRMRRRRFPGSADFVEMRAHADPRVQAILELYRERAMAQNLYRGRPLDTERRELEFYILCAGAWVRADAARYAQRYPCRWQRYRTERCCGLCHRERRYHAHGLPRAVQDEEGGRARDRAQ